MLVTLVVGNSTSAGLLSDWLSPTGLGTIVLAIGVIFAGIEIYLDRRDRQMDRERQLRERPQFKMVGNPILQVSELTLLRGNKETDVSSIRIGIVKVRLENVGELTAKKATLFFQFGETEKSDILASSVWASHVTPARGITVQVLSFVGKTPCEIGDYLRSSFFAPGDIGMDEKRDVVPNGVAAAVCLFTVEGCNQVFHANPNVKGLGSLPFDTTLHLNVVMEDAPYSPAIRNVRLRLLSWNKLESSV